MKYIKAGYNRKFPMEQFGNENPYVEIEIEDGDDPLAVLQEAKNLLYKFHEQSVKQDEAKNVKDISQELPKSQKGVIEQILGCKTEKELSEWDIYVNSKSGEPLKGIYEQRKMQLKNGN
jgi:hypothetical protein